MFSRNKSNQCFNIESVSRKKIVNVQRDNDIFNRYASLSRKGVVFPKEDFSFKPDKSLKNEMVSMIYDNSHHSRNTNAQRWPSCPNPRQAQTHAQDNVAREPATYPPYS